MSDWTFAPLLEIASGRPFNIITGSGDNLQLSSLTGRPNTTVDPACGTVFASKFSPSGTFQEPCINGFVASGKVPTLLQLDGNLGRNAGVSHGLSSATCASPSAFTSASASTWI